jgi:predicted Zn-dependent peptidase
MSVNEMSNMPTLNRSLAPEIKEIESIDLPAYQLIELDNGVPVYIINEGQQEVVKIELMFKAGKWFEPQNLVADLANRMLREGTSKHNARAIADTFDFYGANMNTGTGFETAGLALYTLTKHADKLLPLLHEISSDSVFPQQELDTILTNRGQRLAVDLKKNDFIANRVFVNALFGQQHPYGRITEAGDFAKVNATGLSDYFKKYYHASNLIIIVAGRFNESLLKSLNQFFGGKDWLGQKADETIAYPVSSSAELTHHIEKAESVQSAIITGNLSINKTHPDFLKLSVLNTLFGGYFGSRLMRNIREEKGYTYGIYSSFVSYPHAGFIEIASEVGKEVRQATLGEIEHEINLIRTEPVGEEELRIVKNYMSGKILRSIDGPLKFSETLKGLILYNQDTSYISELLKTVREVSAEELLELAVKYLDFSKMYKVSVG